MNQIPINKTWYGYSVSLDDFLHASKSTQDAFLLEELVYQSNLIEGIAKGWIETVSEGQQAPELAPVLSDHLSSYQYILENYGSNPTSQDALVLHRTLTQRIFTEKAEDVIATRKLSAESADKIKDYYQSNSGAFRKSKVYVGTQGMYMRGCLHYRQIPKAVQQLEHKINEINKSSPELIEKKIWDIHNEFESIHPFIDGNGRVGRLLLNWLSLKHLGKFMVVLAENKKDYYKKISDYALQFKREHPEMHFYKDIIHKNSISDLYQKIW
jgi:hypothetical protein